MNKSPHANGAAAASMRPTPTTSTTTDEQKPPVIDAGLKSLDHYKRALPKWRYELRQRALPLVRWETPYLAWLQDALRSPALDRYFAITANLGTHTFFMIGLPMFFWYGLASFGTGMVRILAAGVFFTGFVKDFFSLPRPLSPPLHRITMSGSTALEYGFPSTHSANAVSAAVYGVLHLHSPENPLPPNVKLGLDVLALFYSFSIVFGRLYCGMHGFLDVGVGSLMGAAISLAEFFYGPALDAYLAESNFSAMVAMALLIIALVRIHPEPADDCPCFDDSVCFAAVVIGVQLGRWHVARHTPYGATPFSLAVLGPGVALLRFALGVASILLWKEAAKPALLRALPHAFRVIETAGLNLPRRFFVPASEYQRIPLRTKVDNVMPSVSDLPEFVNSIRKGGRGRSVSIGPQSAADAYETLAYRERRRRESIGSAGGASPRGKTSNADLRSFRDDQRAGGTSSGVSGGGGGNNGNNSGGNGRLQVGDYERMMGEGTAVLAASPVDETPNENGLKVPHIEEPASSSPPEIYVGQQDELGEKEVFAKLEKPRVRYDVEVVTKLVVYTGIGLVAVEIVPVMFEFVGLGGAHLAYG